MVRVSKRNLLHHDFADLNAKVDDILARLHEDSCPTAKKEIQVSDTGSMETRKKLRTDPPAPPKDCLSGIKPRVLDFGGPEHKDSAEKKEQPKKSHVRNNMSLNRELHCWAETLAPASAKPPWRAAQVGSGT